MKRVLLVCLVFLFFPICPALAAAKVDLNTASLSQLDKLVGVGPAIAQRIVDGRPYSSIDDLLRVKGIGEKTLQNIKDQGLAFVVEVPKETLPIAEKTDNTTNGVPTETVPTGRQVNTAGLSSSLDYNTKSPWLLFMITLGITLVSGAAFLLLKLKLSKSHVRS